MHDIIACEVQARFWSGNGFRRELIVPMCRTLLRFPLRVERMEWSKLTSFYDKPNTSRLVQE